MKGLNQYKAAARGVAVTLTLLMLPTVAAALPNFFTAWQDAYPDSASDDAGCQLCHQNSGGGDGWNPYGWELRQLIRNEGQSINAALTTAETFNYDLDLTGAWNITEIDLDTQPGWARGAVNTICFIDTSCLTNQLPPVVPTEIDPPEKLQDPIVGGIAGGQTIELEDVASGFVVPNYATPAPGLNGYLFVVDQVGVIWQIDLSDGSKVEFLDVSAQLVALGVFGPGSFDERGLLGLAFHPQYATNGRLYTYQSEPVNGAADFSTMPNGIAADHQTVIAEWQVANPTSPLSVVNAASKRVILRIDQPQFNHDGGMLAFGPDNMLYISLGDGGGADDVDGQVSFGSPMVGHGQSNGLDATNPLGAILRIDPLGNSSGNGQYSVPGSNPFTAGGDNRLDEIFAYGLRNVFRFSFDSQTGDLYAGDVGQNDIEEVNIITSGGNYGWNAKEGSFFFYPNGQNRGYVSNTPSPTATAGMIDPTLQYDHDEGLSVMGGYVYRGSDLQNLVGSYVFGDWSTDFGTPRGRLFYSDDMQTIREFKIRGQADLGLFLNGFGQDQNGELYIVGNTTGTPTDTTGVLRKIVQPGESDMCFPVAAGQGRMAVVCL